MFELVGPQEGHSFETGLSLSDYTVLIDAANSYATKYEEARKQRDAIEKALGDRFEIRPIPTDKDELVTSEKVKQAIGQDAARSIIFARTGDGGNRGLTRAALDSGAALWKSNAGYANNLGRAAFPLLDRRSVKRTLRNLTVVRSKALLFQIFNASGEILYDQYLADEGGIGDMANAQVEREKPNHRQLIGRVSSARAKYHDAKVGFPAMHQSPAFKAIRTEKRILTRNEDGQVESAQELSSREVEQDELFWTNIGHIALHGRIRNSRLTDPKMVEVSNRYRTRLGLLMYYLRLFSLGVSGTDIPDNRLVEARLLTDANVQGSGDPLFVPKGSLIRVQRSFEDLLVVTTRRRP